MKVLIGCPVYRRAWILPTWLKYIENQSMSLKDIGLIFELGDNDEETHDILWEWQTTHPEVAVFDGIIRNEIKHHEHPKNGRNWTRDKYSQMVKLRNHLLDRVIAYQPDRFFSLDSDILLEDPNTLEELYQRTEKDSAVSPLSYMKPNSTQYPSVMTWVGSPGQSARRTLDQYPIGTHFRADIIMAAVMMSKPAYETVRYQWHRQGEDLGWSADAARKGFQLYCASDLYGAHIMHDFELEPYLQHGDIRSTTNISLKTYSE